MFGIVCDQLSYWVYIFLWVLPLCIPISYLSPLRKVKRIVWGGYYSFFFLASWWIRILYQLLCTSLLPFGEEELGWFCFQLCLVRCDQLVVTVSDAVTMNQLSPFYWPLCTFVDETSYYSLLWSVSGLLESFDNFSVEDLIEFLLMYWHP